jgi:predicted ATPase
MSKRIVITGGPSTGKTTLIKQLQSRGFLCFEEISRQVTLEARSRGVEIKMK